MILTKGITVEELQALMLVKTLTIKQAALVANMERERLDEAVRAGQLKIMRIPGVRRVSRTELDRWLESLVVKLEDF